MKEQLKEVYKNYFARTTVDTVIRKSYARVFSNDVLRALYYEQMERIFAIALAPDSNCVDVGCHEGNVLGELTLRAPFGFHHAFEPIPPRYEALKARFRTVLVQPIALSDREGKATFHYVKDCDTHSGLMRREYPGESHQIEEISVRTAPLDAVLPAELPIALIKIDVEGAELQVLRGAERTLSRYRPLTIFQHGMGSAEFYGTEPRAVFGFLKTCGLEVSLLESWLKNKSPLTEEGFVRQFEKRLNYIFLAHPPRGSAQ